MAEATQQYHSHREVVTLAKHISRECVKQELQERGHNLYRQYSFKELCEQAHEYLLAHIGEVFAEIRRQQEKVELQVRAINFCAEIMVKMVLQMTIIGYARVSTDGQTLDAQHSALKAAGAEKVFSEKVSGAQTDRKQLAKAIAALSPTFIKSRTPISERSLRTGCGYRAPSFCRCGRREMPARR
jgi:hypothetical protein